MKTNLYAKLLTYNFADLFKQKDYVFFTKGQYNLNIIGVRSDNHNRVTNRFDDFLVVDYNTKGCHKRQIFTITTDPGLTTMKKPINAKGTAILAPGQYRGTYAIAIHNGKYKALCQRLKPVKVYRDNNRDDVFDFDPKTIDSGMFGINIHKSNDYWTRESVDGYSAGCQVFNDSKQFAAFMRLCEKSRELYGNSFTYTLLDEKELV